VAHTISNLSEKSGTHIHHTGRLQSYLSREPLSCLVTLTTLHPHFRTAKVTHGEVLPVLILRRDSREHEGKISSCRITWNISSQILRKPHKRPSVRAQSWSYMGLLFTDPVAENRPHFACRAWLLTISDLVALPVRSRRDRRYFKVRSGPGLFLSVQHFVFPTGRAMAFRILAFLPTSR
jgi:hypothetical protein